MSSQPPYYNTGSPYGGQNGYTAQPPQQYPVAPAAPAYGASASQLPPASHNQLAYSQYPAPSPQYNAQAGQQSYGAYQYPVNSHQQLPPAPSPYSQYPAPSSTTTNQYPPANIINHSHSTNENQFQPPPGAPLRKPVLASHVQPSYESPQLPPRNPSIVGYNNAYSGLPQAAPYLGHPSQAPTQHYPAPNTPGTPVAYAQPRHSDVHPPPVPPRPAGFETSRVPVSSTPQSPQSYSAPDGPCAAIASTPVDDLATQLGSLNVRAPAQASVIVPQDEDVEFPRMAFAEPRPSGQPNFVQQECPGFRQLDYKMSWYRLPRAPNALICMWCYHRHIEPTSLRQSFERIEPSIGSCRFHIYRILLHLWPEAQRTQNLEPLTAFMNKRLQIPNCKGYDNVKYGEGIKFYSPKTEPPKDSVLCEACYEDHVLGSPFADTFMPTKFVMGPKDVWHCAFAGPFAGRALRRYSKQQYGWNVWAQEANKRIYLPACDGKACAATSRKWFKLRGGPETFVSCEACFLDTVALTPFANYFEPYTAAIPAGAQFGCDMKVIPVMVAMHVSHAIRDIGPFWRTASALSTHGPCSTSGSKGGTWYHIRGSSADFCVCSVCYAGIVEPMKAGRYFEARTIDAGHAMMCDFTAGGPRAVEYLLRLGAALDVGVWSQFSSYVDKWASVPLCSKDKLNPGVYYGFADGFPDIAACKKCYEEVIMPSRFDSLVVRREQTEYDGKPLKALCSFFSPNMRSRWNIACDKNDFAGFMAYAKARIKIWCETVPVWEVLLTKQKLAAQQGMTAALAGVMYQGMENIVTASSSHQSDHMYGNSSIGWHDTPYGATGAQYNQDMISSFAQAGSGNVWDTMAQLERRWKTVM